MYRKQLSSTIYSYYCFHSFLFILFYFFAFSISLLIVSLQKLRFNFASQLSSYYIESIENHTQMTNTFSDTYFYIQIKDN